MTRIDDEGPIPRVLPCIDLNRLLSTLKVRSFYRLFRVDNWPIGQTVLPWRQAFKLRIAALLVKYQGRFQINIDIIHIVKKS